MAVVQLADIIQPEYFAEYMANNSMVSTALYQSGILVPNALMQSQLFMGGDVLNIPARACPHQLPRLAPLPPHAV